MLGSYLSKLATCTLYCCTLLKRNGKRHKFCLLCSAPRVLHRIRWNVYRKVRRLLQRVPLALGHDLPGWLGKERGDEVCLALIF